MHASRRRDAGYRRCLADAGNVLSIRSGWIIAGSASNRRAFRYFEGVADVPIELPERGRELRRIFSVIFRSLSLVAY